MLFGQKHTKNSLAKFSFFVLPLFFLSLCTQPDTNFVGTEVCVLGSNSDAWASFSVNRSISMVWFDPISTSPGQLDRCKLIILKPGDKGSFLSADLRMKITNLVYKGANLIIGLDAATRTPGGSEAVGWQYKLNIVPARFVFTDGSKAEIKLVSGKIERLSSDEIFSSLSEFDFNGQFVFLNPSPDGEAIALLTSNSGTSYAIMRNIHGLGKIYYFAYDPINTPELFVFFFGVLR